MYVCSCRGVTDTQVLCAYLAGARTVDDLGRACGGGTGCGGCHRLLARLLDELEHGAACSAARRAS